MAAQQQLSSPYGTDLRCLQNPAANIFPLIFVLTLQAIKDGIEDKKRHESDFKTNNSITQVLTPTSPGPPWLLFPACARLCLG